MPWRIALADGGRLAMLLVEGFAGALMLATAAFTWRDIPPLIAALGGAALLTHSAIRIVRWWEQRVIDKRDRRNAIDRLMEKAQKKRDDE